MQNFAIVEVKPIDEIGLKDYNIKLLKEIAALLKKRNIKLSKQDPVINRFCARLVCNSMGQKVYISLRSFGLQENPYKSTFACYMSEPLWRRLLRIRSERRDIALQQVCDVVHDIVNADVRFVNVKWMTFADWCASPERKEKLLSSTKIKSRHLTR